MGNGVPFYQLRRKIITDHLDRFPDAGSLTIAKILFRDFPGYFKDIEEARGLIRIRRGKHGKAHLIYLTDKKHVKVQTT